MEKRNDSQRQNPKGETSLLVHSAFFLLLWQILLMAQNPGLMADDSGEMVAASFRLGLPHPPGYPLYCLLGRTFAFWPVGTVAFRFNLLSAFVGLLAIGFVIDTCRRLSEREAAFRIEGRVLRLFLPLFVGSTLFLNRSFFAQAMTAKGLVYMLSFLVITVLVWLRVIRGLGSIPKKPGHGLYFILFLFSLGLTNHWQTLALLIPFVILWHFQERNAWSGKNSLIAASLSLLPISVYLYLPLRCALGAQPFWGMPSSLSRFLWVVTRKLALEGEQGEKVIRNLDHYLAWGREYVHLMVGHWWTGFWVLPVIGIFYLGRVRRELAFSLLALYVPVLVALLSVPRDETRFLLGAYLVPLHGLPALSGFAGLVFIFKGMEKQRSLSLVFSGFLFCVLLGWGIHLFKTEDKSRYWIASDFGLNVMKVLPKDALFLAEGDHVLMSVWYERFVRGARPDLVFEPAPFLLHGWGWKELADQGAEYRSETIPGQTFEGRLRSLLEGRRPLFYSLDRGYLGVELEKLPGVWVPQGLVYKWERTMPSPQRISQDVLTVAAAERFRGLGEYWVSPGLDPSSIQIYRYYANQHFLAAHLLHALGQDHLAVRHLALGLGFYPEEAAAYRNIEALLRESGGGPSGGKVVVP